MIELTLDGEIQLSLLSATRAYQDDHPKKEAYYLGQASNAYREKAKQICLEIAKYAQRTLSQEEERKLAALRRRKTELDLIAHNLYQHAISLI